MSLQGLYGSENHVQCARTSFVVSGPFGSQRIEHALIVPKLQLPRQSLSKELVQRAKRQHKIELFPFRDAQLCILVGQDNWPLIMCDDSRLLGDSGLVASHSPLGWAVHGFVERGRLSSQSVPTFATCVSENNVETEEQRLAELDKIIHEYIEFENLGVLSLTGIKNKHERSLAILEATSRKKQNEWETGLLWKAGAMPNINSKSTALKRLYSLEKKLDQNPSFAVRYYREIDRLIDNGYAVKVPENLERPRVWYVPHFGVENVNKPDKVRLVFDAAAKTGGVSMNDLLETGPDLLESLLGVLLRFRQYPVAVKADIKHMYLRVKLIERDRGAQRFLWRGKDREKEPDVYENNTLIFGSKSSPCSAIYVKNKNAERFASTKPEAVRSIVRNSYMDDYLASGKSEQEMRTRVHDVIEINAGANFQLHGWASNKPGVVADVNQGDKLANQSKATLCDEEERVLGLYWDRKEDTLKFNVGLKKMRAELLQGKKKPTKREFFSIVMSVYDPLGIIAPFILQAKFIMQDVWQSGIGWETRLQDAEFQAWFTWLNNLNAMQKVQIPRCYLMENVDYVKTQLHVFVDASKKAYAAVAYLRSVARDGTCHVSLIMSKSRVASKKPMTIPRLELQAAVLGTRMATTIATELDLQIDERIFWSDSMTVIHWIRGEPREKQMFVANRLGEIAEATKIVEWRWVPTSVNAADLATRKADKPMKSDDKWFTGPDFLKEPPEAWPKEKSLEKDEEKAINELEARKEYVGATVIEETERCVVPIRIAILGWRKITKLMQRVRECFFWWHHRTFENRVTSRNLRSRSRKRKRGEMVQLQTPPRTQNESLQEKVVASKKAWYRVAQSACFARELEALRKNSSISKGSKLMSIQPHLDEQGILRAKGRVGKFTSALFQNQPIILDATHYAVKLLIAEFHRRYDHANNETVINELRQQFYIVGLRTRLRWLAKNCITCQLRRAKPCNPPMAELPTSRLAYMQRPFTHCGIDYFGPMHVKIGRSRHKRWGVLFTCMSTRAIHLEIAHSLSASSAIMAIQRFAARRGFPRHMYSDNGTNFVKANKDLKDAVASIDTKKQEDFAAANRFSWHFNPPDAAHMGGAWERLIRSVKMALGHALNEQVPTEEVLATVMSEIEHMVNSRPLTHVSVDPQDEEALTPNHFLIGSSSGHLRMEKYEAEILDWRKHFEWAQQLAQSFWTRWLREYLPTLLPRQKWNASVPPLQLGDVVLITDYQAPRNTWRKGTVVELFPSKSDNIVRIVKVKAGKKFFSRPTNKLIKIFSPSNVV